MGKTIGHVAVVGGLALPVIAEVASLSQAGHFKWNFLSVLALVLLVLYVAYSVGYALKHRKPRDVLPQIDTTERPSVNAKKLVNTDTGKVIGVDVNSDDVENAGLIAKDYPPPPPPVLDLTDSHDISFARINFEGKGTVIKTANSYNISLQDGEVVQRDENDGETPITS